MNAGTLSTVMVLPTFAGRVFPQWTTGAGRRVPLRRRWRADLRRGGHTHRRRTASAAAAADLRAPEHPCRYIIRSALADERVLCNAARQVDLKLKFPWRDDTTHLVM